MLYLDREAELRSWRRTIRLLHVAPEPSLASRLREIRNLHYVSVDRCVPGYDYGPGSLSLRSDILALPFEDESFDVILCNHVLEHIPDEGAAMREVHRVLRADGWAVLMVPLTMNPETLEDLSITDPAERTRLYGQFDHVRLYGEDYPIRLKRAGFRVTMLDYASRFDAEQTRRLGILQGFDDTIVLCRRAGAG